MYLWRASISEWKWKCETCQLEWACYYNITGAEVMEEAKWVIKISIQVLWQHGVKFIMFLIFFDPLGQRSFDSEVAAVAWLDLHLCCDCICICVCIWLVQRCWALPSLCSLMTHWAFKRGWKETSNEAIYNALRMSLQLKHFKICQIQQCNED